MLPLGALYSDGWAGQQFAVRGDCPQLTFTFTGVELGARAVTLTAGDEVRRGRLEARPTAYTFTGAQARAGVAVRFDRSFVPAASGRGADVRPLSARVAVTCLPG